MLFGDEFCKSIEMLFMVSFDPSSWALVRSCGSKSTVLHFNIDDILINSDTLYMFYFVYHHCRQKFLYLHIEIS